LTPELRKTLMEVSTASIASALLKLGLRNIWIRGATPAVGNLSRAVGEAFTMRFLPMREDLTGPALAGLPNSRAAIEDAQAGCMVVIDAMGVADAGVAGDVLCARMVRRGVSGLVTDGVIRDVVGVEQTGLPVWSRGAASPAPGNALTFVGWGMPVACGGVTIFPGDVIVADRDGAVVIPQAMVDAVTAEAEEIERFDAWVFAKVSEGEQLQGLYPPNAENLARYKAETGA
jgi:regulator of RNase E activity RraA